MGEQVYLYHTMRDMTQSRAVSLDRGQRIQLLRMLDSVGMDYEEIGYAGSNEEDFNVFADAAKLPRKHTKVAAFGSTRRIAKVAEEDANLNAIVRTGAPVATIYGKADILHVTDVLHATGDQNLAAIVDSIQFLRAQPHIQEVIFDAEHFFDGFNRDKDYALASLTAAIKAGAHWIVLCDTKGGMLPWQIEEVIEQTLPLLGQFRWGIHTHNDSETGVANALTAVRLGARQVQGTLAGYGERAGNANLTSVIPALVLKMGFETHFELQRVRELHDYFHKLARIDPQINAPYVSKSAFAHGGGGHVDAMKKFEERGLGGIAYEHINPEAVGNSREFLLFELSGRSSVMMDAKHFGFRVQKDDPRIAKVLEKVEQLKKAGYNITGLEAETFLLLDRYFGLNRKYVSVESWNVNSEKYQGVFRKSDATLTSKVLGRERVGVGSGTTLYNTDQDGDKGIIGAILDAYRDMLVRQFPSLYKEHTMQVVDEEVRTIDGKKRVRIEFQYKTPIGESKGRIKYRTMSAETIGVSENTIDAAIEACDKAFNYALRVTTKPLNELISIDGNEDEVYALRGDNFDFDQAGTEHLYRAGSNYGRRDTTRRITLESEVFIGYVVNQLDRKVDDKVRDAFIACLQRYSHDPAFLPQGQPSEDLAAFFGQALDKLYIDTKIGKYNRQFEYVAKVMGTLNLRIHEYIDSMLIEEEGKLRRREALCGQLDALAQLFQRNWHANGEAFYQRFQHWQIPEKKSGGPNV